MIPPWLHSLIGRGRIARTDDSGPVQLVQVGLGAAGSGGDQPLKDDVPRLAEYGFASVVPADADVLLVRLGGQASHSIAIATAHKASRPTGLQPGDVWLYDLHGHAVKLTAAGIEVYAAGDVVKVSNAAKVRCECDIETTGDVIARCDGVPVSLGKLRDAYDVHDHPPVAGAGTWGAGPPNEQV